MARKRIVISSSGGISAGSPFILHGGLFVEQVNPPYAFTQRWAALTDAGESLVAPGLHGGATSFVVGPVIDDGVVANDNLILVGKNLGLSHSGGAQNATGQVIVGYDIVQPLTGVNTQHNVFIGGAFTFHATSGVGHCVVIGTQITVSGNVGNNTLVGASIVCAFNGATVIGNTAGASGDDATAIGNVANAGPQAVAIGKGASSAATTGGIAIGQLTQVAATGKGIAIGTSAHATGDSGVCLGHDTTTLSVSGLAIGHNAQCPAIANWCQIGGRAPDGYTVFSFGQGFNAATGGVQYTWQTTDVFAGAGSNLSGNGLLLKVGAGTGNNANPGNLGFDVQVGVVGAAGTAQQVYTSTIAVRQSDLNIALWGGLAATFGGGAAVLFIKNATTAPTSNPTGGGLLYVVAGALTYRGSGGTVTTLGPA